MALVKEGTPFISSPVRPFGQCVRMVGHSSLGTGTSVLAGISSSIAAGASLLATGASWLVGISFLLAAGVASWLAGLFIVPNDNTDVR